MTRKTTPIQEPTMTRKTHSNPRRFNPGCAIFALALAILGFYLQKRAAAGFRALRDSLPEPPATAVESPVPAPAVDPADTTRYRKEVEDCLADYTKDVDRASKTFERRLAEGRASFAAVRDKIPEAVEPYKSFKKNAALVKAVVTDKLRKTDKTGELIRNDFMEPLFTPALSAAVQLYEADAALRRDLEDARQRTSQRLSAAARRLPGLPSAPSVAESLARRNKAVEAGCANALGTAAGANAAIGVATGLEAIFISQTVRAIVNLCARMSAKAAGKAAASAVAPAADGPFPFGDCIAVAGFGLTAYDVYRMKKKMPEEMRKGLTEAIDKIEADSLAEVRGNARKVLDIYRDEKSELRRAAYAALGGTR